MKHRRTLIGTLLGALFALTLTSPASGEPATAGTVQWEHHWIQDQGDAGGENALEEHTPNPSGVHDLCGGWVSGYASGSGNWIIHHSHISPTFTVAPGGHINFNNWWSFGEDFGGSLATLYVELERDYTTGQHWPNEAERPKFYTRSASGPATMPPVSIDISHLAGHHVKLQFRCVQSGHPPVGITNRGVGSGFTLSDFDLPVA